MYYLDFLKDCSTKAEAEKRIVHRLAQCETWEDCQCVLPRHILIEHMGAQDTWASPLPDLESESGALARQRIINAVLVKWQVQRSQQIVLTEWPLFLATLAAKHKEAGLPYCQTRNDAEMKVHYTIFRKEEE